MLSILMNVKQLHAKMGSVKIQSTLIGAFAILDGLEFSVIQISMIVQHWTPPPGLDHVMM